MNIREEKLEELYWHVTAADAKEGVKLIKDFYLSAVPENKNHQVLCSVFMDGDCNCGTKGFNQAIEQFKLNIGGDK